MFATQAGSAVSGSARTGLISGSHRVLLINPADAPQHEDGQGDGHTDAGADEFHSPLRRVSAMTLSAFKQISAKRAPVLHC